MLVDGSDLRKINGFHLRRFSADTCIVNVNDNQQYQISVKDISTPLCYCTRWTQIDINSTDLAMFLVNCEPTPILDLLKRWFRAR
jgi:hypothetical protein